MNIILFGPPGAGKGTQSNYLVKNFGLFNISTGELLRNEIKKNNLLGSKIKSKIDKGFFVSDNIINDLVEKTISDKKYFNKIVFDGYPRNLNQAKKLDIIIKKFNQKITCVLNINIEQDIIVKRILGRQTCSKCGLIFNKFFYPANKENHLCDNRYLEIRTDDNEETVKKRFDIYNQHTLPIINYYRDQDLLHDINGRVEIPSINKEISGIINRLEA